MTTTLPTRAERSEAVRHRTERQRVGVSRLPYGWPLLAAFGGLPLWWVLGVHSVVWQVAAVPLLAHLVANRRQVRVPRGFGIWGLFLAWTLLSATQLERASQFGPFLYRFSLYISATVFMVFLANSDRERLPLARVYAAFALLFVGVVAGGWLGVVLPNGQFTTPFEAMLPGGLATDPFIKPLVHADFAQVQTFLGYPLGRPQAPFAYTNHWGSMYAILVPIVALGWARTTTRTSPLALQMLLTLSLVPALVSLNRGMALSLLAALGYASVRTGHTSARARQVLTWLIAIFVVLMVTTPLGQLVQDRGDNAHSNAGRETLYSQAVDYASDRPLLGYGAPQQVLGNKILPPVGTQGQFWLVLVSQGWVGVVLFVAFLLQMGRVTRKLPDRVAVAHLLIVIVLVQMFVYELLSAPFQVVFACIGLALREQYADAAAAKATAAAARAELRRPPAPTAARPG